MPIPEKLIVAFVVVLITYLQATTSFFILGPALGGWTSLLAQKILLPLNVTLISIYVNYYLACKTDPGHVPDNWEPPSVILNSEPFLHLGISGPRYCHKCECFKPPRSHHCKQCGVCVLKMDHHCPWIGNCVGFGNYSYFIRFIFSVIICCTYGCYLLLWRLQRIFDARKNSWYSPQPTTIEFILVMLNITILCLVILLVGVLAVYHTYCLFTGQTTIEGSERRKTKRLIRRRKIDFFDYPFDLGFYRNICSVLGDNPILWPWPAPSPGNGVQFAVKQNTDPLMAYYWPPKVQADIMPETEWESQRLVRRDSEGYLVKEITLEDRIEMLQQENCFEQEEVMESEIQYCDSDSEGSDMTDYELE
ncbi:hypothetical protein G6F46_007674 [Rhizopus delemar]|uniref:Palmitoyltransferase n=2 Tax=Rhizopus TaxID=4842 RepID=A0A9P6YU00_9FUNG|nr:hypothetical protein G6F43_000959 [Rhizopus delemar]KAG1536230.1 hypothetical protein G6F51_011083 [Rhizopus arrhizus]KAG1449097.1 hypothetical protein G6F55_010325 [Rhizopus delemar]KAG1495520.1 hypothetical protein G6F54_007111 [Rhizopus delemar]KAG1502805.1 hypothetical protein G6F53_010776 [Rhizopus delemar]